MVHIIENCGCVADIGDVNWGFDFAPTLGNFEDNASDLGVKMILNLAVSSVKYKIVR
jgi:hypothetical protein